MLTYNSRDNSSKEYTDIFKHYHFLAKAPIAISLYLIAIGIFMLLMLFGVDFGFSVAWNGLSIFLVIFNLVAIGACLVGIAYLRETPKRSNAPLKNEFNYKASLQASRWLQNSLVQPINENSALIAGRVMKIQNILRLLSFVAVFNQHAYVFIRIPAKIGMRRDSNEIQDAINEVAEELGFTATKMVKIYLRANEPLGFTRQNAYYASKLHR